MTFASGIAAAQTTATLYPDRSGAAPTLQQDPEESVASTPGQERAPSPTRAGVSTRRGGDPRALRIARLLASTALMVSAFIHGTLAIQLGVGGPLISQGQLFTAQAALSAALALALLTRDDRIWLVAVVLSVVGLGAVIASVYFPIPAIGPFPEIHEPVWLMTMVVSAFAQAAVPTLWLIRQIAPPE